MSPTSKVNVMLKESRARSRANTEIWQYALIDGLYTNLYSALISNTFSSPHFRHIVHSQSISTPTHKNIFPNVE